MKHGHFFESRKPLKLDCGRSLANFRVAYQTWGELNSAKDNAVLVCHALSGDQFAAGSHPTNGGRGWWDAVIGPGKALDTEKYFVICSNVLGGCMGTTGPSSPREPSHKNRAIWGVDFPLITIADMVRAQKRLVEHLEIERLFAVIGGSMGGMQALEWAVSYPKSVRAAVGVATSYRHSAQNISFHEIGRQAVTADPNWRDGDYASANTKPHRGLAVARMVAHITYLSERALARKFGRNLQDRADLSYGFGADFQVESYLRHQGSRFVERFDANSYLYITKAMDYFDLSRNRRKGLAGAFMGSPVKFCLLSFSGDWLFPTSEVKEVVRALNAAGCEVSFAELESDRGHDAFLLREPEFHALLKGFLQGVGG